MSVLVSLGFGRLLGWLRCELVRHVLHEVRRQMRDRTVIAMLLWPRASWIALILTPAIASREANVCRKPHDLLNWLVCSSRCSLSSRRARRAVFRNEVSGRRVTDAIQALLDALTCVRILFNRQGAFQQRHELVSRGRVAGQRFRDRRPNLRLGIGQEWD